MFIIIFFIAIWYLSLFSQTFLQHRYASHGAFEMNRFWERFFYIMAYITQGSSYMSPRAYAIMHRMHHAYTDTELDPHSPSYSKNVFAMMWRTSRFYRSIFHNKMKVEEKFTKNLPDWRSFDKFANSGVSRLLWVAGYALLFVFFASAWYLWILLPVIIAMGAVHGAIINWFAHKYGYTNFTLKNTSVNLLRTDVLMLGESYHNNHHKHPSSPNFGIRKYEIDPVYYAIKVLSWLHIVKIPKLVPAH